MGHGSCFAAALLPVWNSGRQTCELVCTCNVDQGCRLRKPLNIQLSIRYEMRSGILPDLKTWLGNMSTCISTYQHNLAGEILKASRNRAPDSVLKLCSCFWRRKVQLCFAKPTGCDTGSLEDCHQRCRNCRKVLVTWCVRVLCQRFTLKMLAFQRLVLHGTRERLLFYPRG